MIHSMLDQIANTFTNVQENIRNLREAGIYLTSLTEDEFGSVYIFGSIN